MAEDSRNRPSTSVQNSVTPNYDNRTGCRTKRSSFTRQVSAQSQNVSYRKPAVEASVCRARTCRSDAWTSGSDVQMGRTAQRKAADGQRLRPLREPIDFRGKFIGEKDLVLIGTAGTKQHFTFTAGQMRFLAKNLQKAPD